MTDLRERLRSGWVGPIGIALAASFMINQAIENVSLLASANTIRVVNRIGSLVSDSFFQIANHTVAWKFMVWNLAAILCFLLFLWLVALWMYPETDQPATEL